MPPAFNWAEQISNKPICNGITDRNFRACMRLCPLYITLWCFCAWQMGLTVPSTVPSWVFSGYSGFLPLHCLIDVYHVFIVYMFVSSLYDLRVLIKGCKTTTTNQPSTKPQQFFRAAPLSCTAVVYLDKLGIAIPDLMIRTGSANYCRRSLSFHYQLSLTAAPIWQTSSSYPHIDTEKHTLKARCTMPPYLNH